MENNMIENIIKRLETEINKTPSGELRNLLTDVNIIIHKLNDKNLEIIKNLFSVIDFKLPKNIQITHSDIINIVDSHFYVTDGKRAPSITLILENYVAELNMKLSTLISEEEREKIEAERALYLNFLKELNTL